ncbi:MAG: endonuclease/exonuclease/phosphatase family protein [Bacteroidetes bacterium]|nr:endonuclease/exonuclease/phosphatase family protein [Bacteroidota bacterium]
MKRTIKSFFKILAILIVLFILYFVVVLIHGTATDYQPEGATTLKTYQNSDQTVIEDSILQFVIWNVGYGGLGAESDFFYDDGGFFTSGDNMIRTPKPFVEKNIEGALNFIKSTPADFYLFQEVDFDSKRSYYINQFEKYGELLPNYASTLALNYNSKRVPIPVLEAWKAYGKVYSGLGTYSRFQPTSLERHQLPGEYSWPTKIFQLDRCIAIQKYKVANGKELVVMNIHHSAYDKGGLLKKQQMTFMKELVLAAYNAGNYVVVGGDWNQCPAYFEYDTFMPGKSQGYSQINIEADYLPSDWRWVYDPNTPTNRKIKDPYQKDETFVTVIDFFLISPNVKVKGVKTINQDFQFSDHQPVWMEVELGD